MVDGWDCVLETRIGLGGVNTAETMLLEYVFDGFLGNERTKRQEADSQSFKCRFDIWKLNKDRLVWNALVVEHETNAPYCG